MRRFFFLTFALGISTSAAATPLFFQADKNNIQVLPQRFEYNLADEDHIRVGDIVIDSTTFGFQIAASKAFPGKYRARFIWPAGVLKEGSLLIKDNAGKAVWTTNFNRKNIRLQTPANSKAEAKGERTQTAELIVDQLDPALIEDMKYFPFMNVCITRANLDTRIYLCSKEVYLAQQDGRLMIKARSQGKKTPYVEINGKDVGHQGTIFLNDEAETIGFRAMTQSGAILEVETRMQPVDFKDVVLSEDKKELIVTASGTEPVNEEKVKRLSDEEWQFSVDVTRPVLYLKGAGNIPMRQEFYLKGTAPSEKARPTLDENSVKRVYQSTVSLEGTAAEGTTVAPQQPSQSVEKLGKNRFRWTLSEIPAGETTRHYLRVNYDQQSYLAGYDLYRDFPYEASLMGTYWSPAGQVYLDASFTWWIENFMGSDAPWARFHWGASAKQSLLLNKKDGKANLNITHLELLWRAKDGFHFQDKTWGLALPVEMLQASGLNMTTFGLGVFYSDRVGKKNQRFFHWYDVKANYLTGGKSGDIKLNSALQLSTTAYYRVNKQFSWNYGVGLYQYNFDPGDNKMQIQITGGAGFRF